MTEGGGPLPELPFPDDPQPWAVTAAAATLAGS